MQYIPADKLLIKRKRAFYGTWEHHCRYWVRCIMFSIPLLATMSQSAWAGNQQYENISSEVHTIMSYHLHDRKKVRNSFDNLGDAHDWLLTMRQRLSRWESKIPSPLRFLQLIHYEARRAGLDPQLVLAIIQVESAFNPTAVSRANARGMMQIMPFWVKLIGDKKHDLFDISTNIRYGCTILRHYIDLEKGNLFRALGRYNGSTGRAKYPKLVLNALRKNWHYDPKEQSEPYQKDVLKIIAVNEKAKLPFVAQILKTKGSKP